MDNYFVSAFYELAVHARKTHGFELPTDIEHYVVLLLADHVDRPEWMPEDSFAESYFKIHNSSSAKELGDECLFLCGVFPEYTKRHGLDTEYYANIGISSYRRVGRDLRRELFEDLGTHFNTVSTFINCTVRQYHQF